MKLLDKLRSLRRRHPESVSFDELGVVRTMSNGTIESIQWSDLQQVSVLTTDCGPWAQDVFWLLRGSVGGCAVSQGVIGSDKLLERLQELPDFNNEAFLLAMGSTDNAEFVCWRHAP